MTTKEEDQKEIQDLNEKANPEEEEEEEEPVDLELQKEMKGLTISDKDFEKDPKVKKPQKKQKEPKEKKSKKKGQDFLDYANKNNIQINIEYEENKYQLKKTEDPKMGDKYKYNEKRQFNKGGNKQNKNRQFKRNKMSGNKFDIGLRDYYPYNYPQPSVQLSDDKQILEHLEKIFSTENLNKDLYIRFRIKDGKISLDDIAKYNDFKLNKVDSQKLIDVIKESKNLEIINEENKNYIKVKDYDETKLLTIEQISEMKKNQKIHRNPMNNMGNQQFYPPFVNFSNNVFIYNQSYPYYYANPYSNYMNQDNK